MRGKHNNNYFKFCMYTMFQQLEGRENEEKLRYHLGQTHFQFAIKTFGPEVWWNHWNRIEL